MSQEALVELSTYLNLIVKYVGQIEIPYEFIEKGLDNSEGVRVINDEEAGKLIFVINKLSKDGDVASGE